MRKIFALCLLILAGGGALVYRHTRLPNKFGDFGGAPAVQVAELLAHPKDYMKKTVSIEGEVREQCTTMGCYFYFHAGDGTLRVDLQEVAMNAPRMNGKRARVEGRMVVYGDAYQFYASAVEFRVGGA